MATDYKIVVVPDTGTTTTIYTKCICSVYILLQCVCSSEHGFNLDFFHSLLQTTKIANDF